MLTQNKGFNFGISKNTTMKMTCKGESCQREIIVKRNGFNREFGRLCKKCNEKIFDSVNTPTKTKE